MQRSKKWYEREFDKASRRRAALEKQASSMLGKGPKKEKPQKPKNAASAM